MMTRRRFFQYLLLENKIWDPLSPPLPLNRILARVNSYATQNKGSSQHIQHEVLRGEIIILNTGYCWWLQGVSTVYTGVSTVHCLYIQGVWTENCWCVLSTGGCWPEPSLCTIIDNLINYICISATVKHSGLQWGIVATHWLLQWHSDQWLPGPGPGPATSYKYKYKHNLPPIPRGS